MTVEEELKNALEESVKLQSHYAKLLNMHDGGERLQFENAEAWMERLRSLKERVKEDTRPAISEGDSFGPVSIGRGCPFRK